MARSLDLNILTAQPDSYRNSGWEQAFFQGLVDGKVKLEKPEPITAPDGWPYLFAKTSPDATEPVVRIMDWLHTRGIGLVINGHKQVPDYVFSYGMIWNWKERGQFLTPTDRIGDGEIIFNAGDKVVAGPPTRDYLPEYVRQILFQFLEGQGIKTPKILVLSRDGRHFDLCFSLESLGSPPQNEHKGIAQALAWFLPSHYSIVIVSESVFPNFVLLMDKGGR